MVFSAQNLQIPCENVIIKPINGTDQRGQIFIEKKVVETYMGRRQSVLHNKKLRAGQKSLSTRLHFVLYGINLALVIAFLISVYYITVKERREYEIREAESLLNSVSVHIQSNVQNYMELSGLIMRDDKLVDFLRADAGTINNNMINDACLSISDILAAVGNVDSAIVLREDMFEVSAGQNVGWEIVDTGRDRYNNDYTRMKSAPWKEQIWSNEGSVTYSINGDNAVFKENGEPVLTIAQPVYDLSSQEQNGILLINITSDMMEEAIEDIQREDVCIIGTNGAFFAGNEELSKYYRDAVQSASMMHQKQDEGEEQILVSSCFVGELPLVVIHVTHAQAVNISSAGYVLLFLLILCVFAALAVGLFLTKNITNPVIKMANAMEENEESGMLEKIYLKVPHNELYMLMESYNNMVEHVDALTKRLNEKEKIVQKAEMRVLQEQIKPHFLYNSLETIGFLAMDAGAEEAYTALETLGSFCRNFLSKGDREIPLRKEIAIVQDYLSLQKLRYGDIIEDEYDIVDYTLDCIVPKLILQPLVENSIYHGIRPKGEKGTIQIRSRFQEGNLHLYIKDTGVGMSQEQIKKMLSTGKDIKSSAAGERSGSFGLRGTIERIRGFCDRYDAVQIRSEVGEYTEIEFIIPRKDVQRRENV